MEKLDACQMENVNGGQNWDEAVDCIQDLYSNYGWLSFSFWVSSALDGGATAVIIAGGCLFGTW